MIKSKGLPPLSDLKVYLSSQKNYMSLEQRNVYIYLHTRCKHVFCPKRHLGKIDWNTINTMLAWCDILIVSGDWDGVVEKRSYREVETAFALNKSAFKATLDTGRVKGMLRPRSFEVVSDIELVGERMRKEHLYGKLICPNLVR